MYVLHVDLELHVTWVGVATFGVHSGSANEERVKISRDKREDERNDLLERFFPCH